MSGFPDVPFLFVFGMFLDVLRRFHAILLGEAVAEIFRVGEADVVGDVGDVVLAVR